MSARFATVLICVAAAVLLLSACGVETQAGVVLATAAVTPTTTPVPTPTPDPLAMDLPHTLTRDFMGTVVELRYPQSWVTEERGQYAFLTDSTRANNVDQPPALVVFIQLSRRFELDTTLDSVAAQALSAQNQGMIEFDFLPPESSLHPDDATPFDWGEHSAALFRWHSADNITGLSLSVMSADRARFVWMLAMSADSLWEAYRPTLAAMLASVSLDGESLPAADVLAAVGA